jgi:hypothetical protein
LTIFAVRVKEYYGDPRKAHVFLIEAHNENQAKNLAEAKWYELNPNVLISEGDTQVWEIEKDFATNPSVRA